MLSAPAQEHPPPWQAETKENATIYPALPGKSQLIFQLFLFLIPF